MGQYRFYIHKIYAFISILPLLNKPIPPPSLPHSMLLLTQPDNSFFVGPTLNEGGGGGGAGPLKLCHVTACLIVFGNDCSLVKCFYITNSQ